MIIIMLVIIAIFLLVLVLANDRAREVLISLLHLTGRIALWVLALGVVAVLVVFSIFFLSRSETREIGKFLLGLSLILLFGWFCYKGYKVYSEEKKWKAEPTAKTLETAQIEKIKRRRHRHNINPLKFRSKGEDSKKPKSVENVTVSCPQCLKQYLVTLSRYENQAVCPFCGGVTTVNIEW
jgi:energy-coupling factor transporter transmembrane protein EcfT